MRNRKIWLNYLVSNLGVPVTKTGKGAASWKTVDKPGKQSQFYLVSLLITRFETKSGLLSINESYNTQIAA